MEDSAAPEASAPEEAVPSAAGAQGAPEEAATTASREDYLTQGLDELFCKGALASDFAGEVPRIWHSASDGASTYLERLPDCPSDDLRQRLEDYKAEEAEIEEELLSEVAEIRDLFMLLDSPPDAPMVVGKIAARKTADQGNESLVFEEPSAAFDRTQVSSPKGQQRQQNQKPYEQREQERQQKKQSEDAVINWMGPLAWVRDTLGGMINRASPEVANSLDLNALEQAYNALRTSMDWTPYESAQTKLYNDEIKASLRIAGFGTVEQAKEMLGNFAHRIEKQLSDVPQGLKVDVQKLRQAQELIAHSTVTACLDCRGTGGTIRVACRACEGLGQVVTAAPSKDPKSEEEPLQPPADEDEPEELEHEDEEPPVAEDEPTGEGEELMLEGEGPENEDDDLVDVFGDEPGTIDLEPANEMPEGMTPGLPPEPMLEIGFELSPEMGPEGDPLDDVFDLVPSEDIVQDLGERIDEHSAVGDELEELLADRAEEVAEQVRRFKGEAKLQKTSETSVLPKNLRKQRENAGLSLREEADRIGDPEAWAYISELETGKADNPTVEFLDKIKSVTSSNKPTNAIDNLENELRARRPQAKLPPKKDERLMVQPVNYMGGPQMAFWE